MEGGGAFMCNTTIKELKISGKHDRVVTTPNIINIYIYHI